MTRAALATTSHTAQNPAPAGRVLQRKCACGTHTPGGGECAACAVEPNRLQRSATSEPARNIAPDIVHDVINSPGHPLDTKARAFFEPRFGRTFGDVRIHAGAQAAASSDAVNAEAYTVGSHIAFGSGRYAPWTPEGRTLLAHELAHVTQQNDGSKARSDAPLPIAPPRTTAEREADMAAASVASGRALGSCLCPSAANMLHRRSRDGDDPIHRPLIDDFRHRHGLDGSGHDGGLFRGPTDAQIKYQLLPMEAMRRNYENAVASLRTHDMDIYRYLSGTRLNGGPTTVLAGHAIDRSVNPPITIDFTFNLTARTAPLPAPEQAKFTRGNLSLTRTGQHRVLRADMIMEVTETAALTPGALGRALFHEGLHMLLYIQGLVPPTHPSPHVRALANYRSIARSLPAYQTAEAEIEVAMQLDWQLRHIAQPPNANKAANETMDHIIEEKYVFDQETIQYGTHLPNSTLARGYLREAFRVMGARFNPADPSIVRTIMLITSVLDEIDRRTRSAQSRNPSRNPASRHPPGP